MLVYDSSIHIGRKCFFVVTSFIVRKKIKCYFVVRFCSFLYFCYCQLNSFACVNAVYSSIMCCGVAPVSMTNSCYITVSLGLQQKKNVQNLMRQ